MSLLISSLEKTIDSERTPVFFKEMLAIVAGSVNDWPGPIISLEDFERELHSRLGEEIDRYRMEEYSSKIDLSKNAWEAESLCQLVEIFRYYEEGKLLREILKDIRERLEE